MIKWEALLRYGGVMQALDHCLLNSIINEGDYVEKSCLVDENLLYQKVLLCSLYLV